MTIELAASDADIEAFVRLVEGLDWVSRPDELAPALHAIGWLPYAPFDPGEDRVAARFVSADERFLAASGSPLKLLEMEHTVWDVDSSPEEASPRIDHVAAVVAATLGEEGTPGIVVQRNFPGVRWDRDTGTRYWVTSEKVTVLSPRSASAQRWYEKDPEHYDEIYGPEGEYA